jgi:hypothetical protein
MSLKQLLIHNVVFGALKNKKFTIKKNIPMIKIKPIVVVINFLLFIYMP